MTLVSIAQDDYAATGTARALASAQELGEGGQVCVKLDQIQATRLTVPSQAFS